MTEADAERFLRFEAAVARNIRNHRRARGMSQRALAQCMTDRGYPLQQTMVGRLEGCVRALRVGELYAIADSLDVSWRDLMPRNVP